MSGQVVSYFVVAARVYIGTEMPLDSSTMWMRSATKTTSRLFNLKILQVDFRYGQ